MLPLFVVGQESFHHIKKTKLPFFLGFIRFLTNPKTVLLAILFPKRRSFANRACFGWGLLIRAWFFPEKVSASSLSAFPTGDRVK